MSSCEVIQLPPSGYLDLYAHQLPQVLRPILHTIIFHRSLGLIRPQEVDSELFDLTWVHCGDQEVDRKVDEKIVQFTSWLEKNPGKRAQVCLSFYEKRQKVAWFGSQEQRLYWEQWNINLSSRTEPGTPEEQAEQQQRTELQLEECILSTIRTPATLAFLLSRLRRRLKSTPDLAVGEEGLADWSQEPSSSAGSEQGNTEEESMIYDDVPWGRNVGMLSTVQRRFLLELEASLSRKLASNIIMHEFVALEAASDKALREDIARGRFRVALAAKGRNRYSDVLPYDDHRVRLQSAVPDVRTAAEGGSSSGPTTAGHHGIASATPSRDACYINASSLESPDQDVPWHLIAAQAPLRSTRAHFWQAVLESGARNVVQLANYSEAGVVKAHPYHAADLGWKKVYAGISVKTLASESKEGTLIQTTLDVCDRSGSTASLSETRFQPEGNDGRVGDTAELALTTSSSSSQNTRRHVRVRHWLYTGWPDHGVPQAADCGALLDLVDDMVPEVARPIVVHCSAGIGRTGVFAVLLISARRVEAALQECEHDNKEPSSMSPNLEQLIARLVDLRSLVAALRAQRAGCVQTAEQYYFAFSALLELVKRRRRGSGEDNES